MPRAKRHLPSKAAARTQVELSAAQRTRLRRCGLPEHALPAIEEIARRAIAQANIQKSPSPAQARAAMARLRNKIGAARSAIVDTDEWTKGVIDVAHAAAWHRRAHSVRETFRFVMESADRELAELEAAIGAAEGRLANGATSQPRLFALNVALGLLNAFQAFGLQFNRTKRSRAKETLYVILNFITPTGIGAVEHHIREAEKLGK